MNRKATEPTPRNAEELDERITRPNEQVLEAIGSVPGDFAVLGAGGKMGFHLCVMLHRTLEQLGRKDRITAVSRFGSPAVRENFERKGIEVVQADLSDPEQVRRLEVADNVFFLAGVKFGSASNPELLERMNIFMPRLVARHYARSRIVALSTGCVYSFTTPESGGSTENDPTDPPGDYARSCLGREEEFTRSSVQYGTPCVLIRLNYSVELRYGVLVDIARKVSDGEPVDVETGYVNVIWQGDALSHILQSLVHASSPPRILNVAGGDILAVRDLAAEFGKHFGKQAVITGTEAPTAWLSNSTCAGELLGPPQVGVDQMVSWVADWLRQGGELLGKPTHFENREGAY